MLACSKSPITEENVMNVKSIDISQYSADKPIKPLHMLFIHHSCGGHLFADKGERIDKYNGSRIYITHPNGGGLRSILEANNYIVHEASYGSLIGEETDVCHWNVKFRDLMEKILVCKEQDTFFDDGTRNNIVMFKSCFPNNWIASDGTEPGDPDSCERTTANYKAAYKSLLDYFRKHPDTLFVALTPPALAEPILNKKRKIIETLKVLTGRPDTIENVGKRARSFNNWLKDVENGWLKGYELKNVVVFDYYDVLTNNGESNWSRYPTQGGRDSHPSSEGNRKAAEEFIPFLNSAVNRMGISH